jgi:hypothetical protein
MARRIRIIVEYALAFVLILLLLVAIAGVIAVKFYGDNLQEYVMQQVNDRLDTKVDVEDVSVKVFHKFPSTSIVLKNITVWSSHNFDITGFEVSGADTLLSAETISVSFNLPGVILKRYNLRQLEISNGSLYLFTDLTGEGNYMMLGKKEKKRGGERLVDIAHLKVNNFHVLLVNQAKQLKSDGRLEQLDLNVRFSNRNTLVKGSLKGSLYEVSNKGILYASDRRIGVRLNLDMKDSVCIVQAGHLQIDRVMADMDGRFQRVPGKGVEMNLIATARDLEIHEVLDLLPGELSNSLKEIRGNGIMQLYTKVTGIVSSTLTPRIEADFQTSNANLYWERVPFSLKNLNLTGSYSNGGEFNPVTTSLRIESISAVIGQDHLSGRGEIYNFYDPDFSFQLKGNIHPEQWKLWYDAIPLDQVTGTVISDIKVSGSYDRLKPRGNKFVAFDITGGVSLEDVAVRITKEGIPFENMNGSVAIDNDFWEPSFSGTFGQSDFSISGKGLNLLSAIIDGNETLVASATFRSGHFDLQQLLDQLPRHESVEGTSFRFPAKLDLRLAFIINDFVKERLKASNVRGVAYYDAPFFHIDSLTMQTMDGSLRGSLRMIQDSEGDIYSSVDASLHNLDISQLFYAFNNFGQKQLTNEHLKGTISGTTVFSAEFDSTFSINPASILSENEITIRDGELNSFSPIMALSRFIEVDELQNIRFKTLKNTILIRDNQVIIPVMEIQSSAIDLSASGTHDFNNLYDYRLQLKLSELLYSKARGSRSNEFEMATDESDTRTLFLKVYNSGNGPAVEMDREKTAKKIREDLKNEKSELKAILNEELGLFKPGEGVVEQRTGKEENEDKFRFDFSDEPDTTLLRSDNREKRRWRKNPPKPDSMKNKPAKEFVIEE